MCVHVCSVASVSQLLVTLWTTGLQAPLSMGFCGQEYQSGLPCPPPGDLTNLGIEPTSPPLQADSLPTEPPGKPYPPDSLLFFFFLPHCLPSSQCFLPLESENESISKTNDLRAFSWGSKLSALYLSSSLRALKQQRFSTRCNEGVSKFDDGDGRGSCKNSPADSMPSSPSSPHYTHID